MALRLPKGRQRKLLIVAQLDICDIRWYCLLTRRLSRNWTDSPPIGWGGESPFLSRPNMSTFFLVISGGSVPLPKYRHFCPNVAQ